MTARSALPLEEDLVHRPSGEAAWRESYYYDLCDPVAGLLVYSTFGKRPAKGHSGYLVTIWARDLGLLVGQAVDSVTVHNDHHSIAGLELETVSPFQEWHLAFEGDLVRVPLAGLKRYQEAQTVDPDRRRLEPVQFDLRVVAASDPYAFAAGPDWHPLFQGHHEQLIRSTGTVSIGGAPRPIDGVLGIRDHSWGTRKWMAFDRTRWIACTFPNGPHLSLLRLIDRGGSAFLDGALYGSAGPDPIVAYEEEISEVPSTLKPEPASIAFAVTSASGVRLEIEATVLAVVPVTFRSRDEGGLISWNDRAIVEYRCGRAVGMGTVEFQNLVHEG
jgi:hypothetical protein